MEDERYHYDLIIMNEYEYRQIDEIMARKRNNIM
jgi:hypothetical protein